MVLARGYSTVSTLWRDLQDRARSQLLVLKQCHGKLASGAFAD